jgi:hypothetical protein
VVLEKLNPSFEGIDFVRIRDKVVPCRNGPCRYRKIVRKTKRQRKTGWAQRERFHHNLINRRERMKKIRAIVGILFFFGVMVGAIPAHAKTDPTTGLRVVKPYYFAEVKPQARGVALSKGFAPAALSAVNVPIVDPDKVKIRARVTFQLGVTYHLIINVREKTGGQGQVLFTTFNEYNVGSGATALKGKIALTMLEPMKMESGTNHGEADVRVLSSGWPNGADLVITVQLRAIHTDIPRITQTGYVTTSLR